MGATDRTRPLGSQPDGMPPAASAREGPDPGAPTAPAPPAATVAEPSPRGRADGAPAPAVGPLDPTAPPSPDSLIGRTIDGRWIVESAVGEGGMGVVYRARHRVIGKPVAVKVLRRQLTNDAEAAARFRREARTASSIGNPHIVDVSDSGELPDGSTYFVMEYLEGRSLKSVVRGEAPLSVARMVHIGLQVADGLAAAHARGIVHRDLKPDNVFLVARGADRDFVKILDFGIAKVDRATQKLTKQGMVFGTARYMSPEQAIGETVDHRADVYALGTMVYEMATGRTPFQSDDFMTVLLDQIQKPPVPLRQAAPQLGLPAELEAVVMRALAKEPAGRQQSMAEFAEGLRAALAGEPSAASPREAIGGAATTDAVEAPAGGGDYEVPVRSTGAYVVAGAIAAAVGAALALIVLRSSVLPPAGQAAALPAPGLPPVPASGSPVPSAPPSSEPSNGAAAAAASGEARPVAPGSAIAPAAAGSRGMRSRGAASSPTAEPGASPPPATPPAPASAGPTPPKRPGDIEVVDPWGR